MWDGGRRRHKTPKLKERERDGKRRRDSPDSKKRIYSQLLHFFFPLWNGVLSSRYYPDPDNRCTTGSDVSRLSCVEKRACLLRINTVDKKLGVPSNPAENVLKIKDNNTNNLKKKQQRCMIYAC